MPPEAAELTDLQLMILAELWSRKAATVGQLHDALSPRAGASRKTIAILLDRLERRGFVSHRKEERRNVYRAVASRRRVLLARVGAVLGALFPNAAPAHAVSKGEVRAGDVAALIELLRRDVGAAGTRNE